MRSFMRCNVKVAIQHRKFIIYLLMVLIALVPRIIFLGTVPPPLYYDEVAMAYAPFLYIEGIKHCHLRDLIFYTIHFMWPLYKIFGPNPFIIRLPFAVYGSLLCLVIFFIARKVFGAYTAIIAYFISLFTPWLLHFSRYAVPAISGAFYTSLVTLIFLHLIERPTYRKSFLFFLILVLASFTHAIVFPSVTIAFGVLALIASLNNKSARKYILIPFLIFFLFTSILTISYVNEKKSPHVTLKFVSLKDFSLKTYFYLHPDFLLFDGGKRFTTTHGFSIYLPVDMYLRYSPIIVGQLGYVGVFFYVGAVILIYDILVKEVSGKERLFKLIITWIMVSFFGVIGLARYDNPNAARGIILAPLLVIIEAYGITSVIKLICVKNIDFTIVRNKINCKSLALCLSLAVILISFIPYLHFYFNKYSIITSEAFDHEYFLLAGKLRECNLKVTEIYIHDTLKHWYANYLMSFYLRIPLNRSFFLSGPIEWSSRLQSRESSALFVTSFRDDFKELLDFGIPYINITSVSLSNRSLYALLIYRPTNYLGTIGNFSEEIVATLNLLPNGTTFLNRSNKGELHIYKEKGLGLIIEGTWKGAHGYYLIEVPVHVSIISASNKTRQDHLYVHVQWKLVFNGTGKITPWILLKDVSNKKIIYPVKFLYYNKLLLKNYESNTTRSLHDIKKLLIGIKITGNETFRLQIKGIEIYTIRSSTNTKIWNDTVYVTGTNIWARGIVSKNVLMIPFGRQVIKLQIKDIKFIKNLTLGNKLFIELVIAPQSFSSNSINVSIYVNDKLMLARTFKLIKYDLVKADPQIRQKIYIEIPLKNTIINVENELNLTIFIDTAHPILVESLSLVAKSASMTKFNC